MYRGLTEVVSFISSLGLQQILFSNGTLISRETADFLFENRVSMIIKCNSFKPEVQDLLTGVDGVSRNIKKGMEHLMAAGYPGEQSMLGIQTVICRQNIGELPEMWTWARERGIIPYFEMLTKQGRARANMSLDVGMHETRSVFEKIEEIDRKRFGITWRSRPTVVAFSCKRHLYSCLINSQGNVQPCTGIDIAIGNIRKKPLQEILENSSMINNLRNIYQKIEGACKTCEHNCECYGCRGNAYQITGNYLASDPTCWRLQQMDT
jgi:radical SAM protein with 4Fe4S-binding SPASM domain